jgi:lipopolysaccharide export system permease protein
MFTILNRYLLRANLFYVLVCMGLGSMLYLMTDIFDRLDDFLEAGLGPSTMLAYFGLKIPLILSQIAPAVFLIALVIQLGLLSRNRELMALEAGGISYGRIAAFFVTYAIIWSVLQLGFSQVFGVVGLEHSSRIWAEDVRNRKLDADLVKDVWFREGTFMVHFAEARPSTGQGTDITVYQLSGERQTIQWIFTAKTFTRSDDVWLLNDVRAFSPREFATTVHPEVRLFLRQGLSAFVVVGPQTNPAQLPLWQLGGVIDSLSRSGSNVEILRTAWHGKVAYAFSILSMALLALAVTSFGRNIYVNVTVSLLATFVFYGVYIVGMTMGEKGLVPALVGAWFGNVLFGLASLSRLVWVASKE